MKLMIVVFALLAITLSAVALNPSQSVEEEVMQAKKALVQALAQCDSKNIKQLMTDERINITAAGQVRELHEVWPNLTTNCKPGKPAKLEDLRVKVYGDTAILVGRITLQGSTGISALPARFSSVWVKRDGRWQEASMQNTPIQAK